MTRRLISSGSHFETLAGYSRAVVDGDWVFVSGTTGYDYATGAIASQAGDQAAQALRNIEAALDQAGAALADVVRVRIYIAERADFADVAAVLGRRFGDIRPANTTVIAALVAPEMKVEIEVTALRRGAGAG
jgi:enamine deaminase RidA (YjgF/YER057c/UK114 family)